MADGFVPWRRETAAQPRPEPGFHSGNGNTRALARASPRSCFGPSILVAYALGALDLETSRDKPGNVSIDIQSSFEMVDLVQVVFESLSSQVGFDADSAHWMSVAIRESVTNAVRHGNKLDPRKRVIVHFQYSAPEFTVVVEDEGEGFDPENVPDPLAEENLLRASGRGIFFMKNFMDEVSYRFEPNRGTRVTMMKRVNGAR
jgi:serine/threonine-protein kinase RsbW